MEQSDQQSRQQSQSAERYKPLFGILQTIGIALIILVAVWTSHYRGGFAWSENPTLEFNWHPMLMTVGFVFLYANAMLIYRTQRNIRKRRLKLIHGGLMVLVIAFVIIALIAVFDSHNFAKPPIPNMYTLHSWIGLTTVILFCCQLLAGCIAFLYPGLYASLRTTYMPIHVYFGIAAFIGVITTCLIGINEKLIFALDDKYRDLPSEAKLAHTIGLFLTIFGGLTVYLLTKEEYRRLPRPEDNNLLQSQN